VRVNRLLISIGLVVISRVAPALAHDVPTERIVQIYIRPEGAELVVLLRIPTALLADANLPETGDGHLKLREIDPALRLVAADVASNLECEQDERPLAPRRTRAMLSAVSDRSFSTLASARQHLRGDRLLFDQDILWNEAFVDVELDYAIAPSGRGLSARFNLFRSSGQTIRTVAVYQRAPGTVRTFSLVGDPERVQLDPDRSDVVRGFAGEGFRALVERGDWLLFLVCLALPWRVGSEAAARGRPGPAVLALLLGELIALPAGAAWMKCPPDARAALQLTAASGIVIAALQNIAGATARWRWPLALVFGLITGFIFGLGFHDVAAFAGSHPAVALCVFMSVIAAAQIWAVSVSWSAVGFACRSGLPVRLATVLVSIVVLHTAVHWMMERGELLARSGTVTSDHALGLVTLAWTGLILGAGVLGGESVR
jgi:hypothetical protein